MSATNRGAWRNPRDHYVTPRWAIEALLPHLPTEIDLPGHTILDPGAGTGAITSVLVDRYPHCRVNAIELDAQHRERLSRITGHVYIEDYLDSRLDFANVGLVVGNPPFSLAQEFAERSIQLAKPRGGTVALLLRLAFLESRKRLGFHSAHPADVHVFASRPSFQGGPTDNCAYAWFIWGPGRGGRWAMLPDEKPRRARRRAS